jgi:hypothetical protein
MYYWLNAFINIEPLPLIEVIIRHYFHIAAADIYSHYYWPHLFNSHITLFLIALIDIFIDW